MPEVRLELTSRCRDRFLRPARIPFRHSGARLVLRRHDSLDIPLLGEHALREVQPLLDIGEPSLHVLDRSRQVAPGPPWPAVPIRWSDPPRDSLGDRHGHDDEPYADGPLGNTEHTPPRASH